MNLALYCKERKRLQLQQNEACYLSPEELEGTNSDKFASDVWKLAAVLFEAATGKALYKFD